MTLQHRVARLAAFLPVVRPLPSRADEARGQILVILAGGMVAVIILVGLVIDGGNLWAQQRIVQNAADAAAESGAVVLAERLAGANLTGFPSWDDKVAAQLNATAAANHISVKAAFYTDVCGIPLRSDGTAALTAGGIENLSVAAQVGTGLPGGSAVTPDCPSLVVGPPAGVLVLGEKNVSTYFLSIAGMTSVAVGNRATAVAGYLQGCGGSGANACVLLPMTIPVNVATCDGQNNLVPSAGPWPRNQIIRFPLCGNAAGNVGWLDWYPPGGGLGEVVCSILHPNNPPLDLPEWLYAPQSGNTNGGGGACGMSVEEALRTYDGETVMVPQFDSWCVDDPDESQVATPPSFGCPTPAHGGGSNAWYHVPSFAYLTLCSPGTCAGLHGAYIQGNNAAVCDSGGNGATSCIIGMFTEVLGSGTVGSGVGGGAGSKTLGVQLIK